MKDPSPAPPPVGLWRAPLAPVAVAVTAGIVIDQYLGDDLGAWRVAFYGSTAAVALLAWIFSRACEGGLLSWVYLCLTVTALAAAYHDYRLHWVGRDDVGWAADDGSSNVTLRGWVEEEPIIRQTNPAWTSASGQRVDYVSMRTFLRVKGLKRDGAWLACSGRVHLHASARDGQTLPDLRLGDEIEVSGSLTRLRGVSNPGQHDATEALAAQGIRSMLLVGRRDQVTLLGRGWPSLALWPAVVRSEVRKTLDTGFPDPGQDRVRALAATLLLGDQDELSQEEWALYKETGVVHALAVSGQHLGVLGAFLWFMLRLVRMRRRRAAVIVALALLGYALLTGGNPPVLRAAVMVSAFCGAAVLRRSPSLANDFALAWLAVVLVNPADLSTAGFQLSFLCVAILYFVTSRWLRWEWFAEPDPLAQLLDAERPWWLRALRKVGWWVVEAYLVSTILWFAILPLLAFRYNLVPAAALLIGPPVLLLTSVSLVTGFLAFPVMFLCPPLGPVVAWPTFTCLWLCQTLVNGAATWPVGPVLVPDLPVWWVVVFYGGLVAGLFLEPVRLRWRWLMLAATVWLCVGLTWWLIPAPRDELRCTFLAVGHGGCTVIETPDGRTILYDAGAMGRPDVAQRLITPYLWSRGVRRIDEVFLSHADTDHFNGLPLLADRFAVGRVCTTPTFGEKPITAVRQTLDLLAERRIPIRVVKADDYLLAGSVTIEVLHPPESGPEGIENVRSLVLLIRHEGHAILLTGDLTGEGMKQVLSRPPVAVDVLMAPHHGSAAASPQALAAWARPKWVVSSEGPPRSSRGSAESFRRAGAVYLSTWDHGAVTVRSRRGELDVTWFRRRPGREPEAVP